MELKPSLGRIALETCYVSAAGRLSLWEALCTGSQCGVSGDKWPAVPKAAPLLSFTLECLLTQDPPPRQQKAH